MFSRAAARARASLGSRGARAARGRFASTLLRGGEKRGRSWVPFAAAAGCVSAGGVAGAALGVNDAVVHAAPAETVWVKKAPGAVPFRFGEGGSDDDDEEDDDDDEGEEDGDGEGEKEGKVAEEEVAEEEEAVEEEAAEEEAAEEEAAEEEATEDKPPAPAAAPPPAAASAPEGEEEGEGGGGGGEEEGEEPTEVVNWSGTHSAATPHYYEPSSIEEIAAALAAAEAEGRRLRVVGSALSPNALGLSSEGMLCMCNMNE